MGADLQLYQQQPRDLAQATFDLVPSALELAKQIAPTSFVPAGLRNNVPATLAAILTGAEIGLPPMASLANIHVIDGRPGLSATAMRALILSRGHAIRFSELSRTRVVIHGRRKGEDNETTVTWTMDDAQAAGLAGKQTWRNYSQDMLMARATGRLGRAIFADVIAGIPYTVEELQDGFIEDATRPTAPAEAPGEQPAAEDKPRRTARRTRRESAPPPTPPLPQDDGAPPEPPLPETGETEPTAPPTDPPRTTGPGPQAAAGEPAPGEHLTLAQQIAMACGEAGIERTDLLVAMTGKTSGREITREQAVSVLEAAKAIARGERRLLQDGDAWVVLPVVDDGSGDLFGGRS